MKALSLDLVKITAQDAASTMTWCSKKHKTEADTATYFFLSEEKRKKRGKQEGKKETLGRKK